MRSSMRFLIFFTNLCGARLIGEVGDGLDIDDNTAREAVDKMLYFCNDIIRESFKEKIREKAKRLVFKQFRDEVLGWLN